MLIGLVTLGLVWTVSRRTEPGTLSAFLMFGPPGLLCLLAAERPARFALCLAGLLLASSTYDGVHGKPLYRQRSFFGGHRVTEAKGFRQLIHGNTVHGMESLDPKRSGEPLTYYHKDGPIGRALLSLADGSDPGRLNRVGIVGLGTGDPFVLCRVRAAMDVFRDRPRRGPHRGPEHRSVSLSQEL